MKKLLIVVFAVAMVFAFAGCADIAASAQARQNAFTSDAAVARRNLETAEQNFQIFRRVVFYNGINGEYILTIEGRLSVNVDTDGDLVVTVKTDNGEYLKHYLGLSDNVTYFSEALESSKVSTASYRVIFKPSTIIPDIDVR